MLFVCAVCHCVDHVELAGIDWDRIQTPHTQWLCTCCQGKQWHHQFPREPYDGDTLVINRPTSIGNQAN